jgi:acyl-CoA thioester hydrolase
MDLANLANMKITDFKIQSYDKIRYSDLDRQGHVNNRIFSTFLETGRVELFYVILDHYFDVNESHVIAKLDIHYKKEIKWPGRVEIGTAIDEIKNSSMVILQVIYQENEVVAVAKSVIVNVCDLTKKSKLLSDKQKKMLLPFVLKK